MSPFNVRTPEMVAFTATQAEYNDYIWNLSVSEPLSGYNSPADLELTDEDRALVLRAKPELDAGSLVRTHLAIERQVFTDVRAQCDSCALEAEQFLDGNHMTARERHGEDLLRART